MGMLMHRTLELQKQAMKPEKVEKPVEEVKEEPPVKETVKKTGGRPRRK